jgi:phosphatidate cytidylyltransferase
MVPRTWLTQELLFNSGILLPEFLDNMLFRYHSFFTFSLFALGMILFVLTLEEGFYAYQFKQMGWSILNLIVIVSSGHGLLLGLWKVRIWFVYTVLCMCVRDVTDKIVSKLGAGPTMHSLTPKATILGYLLGAVASFAFYSVVADEMLNHWWFNVSPIKLGLAPFDREAVLVDTSAALFKARENHWELGAFGDYQFVASPIKVHLGFITAFIALVAPFGALFFTALKYSLHAEQLGKIFANGGIIDRVDCLLICGLFLFIYIHFIVYQQ